MTTNREQKHVKLNLCIDKAFFDLLQRRADDEFMKVSTWTKWFLKKNLLKINKNAKPVNENEHAV
jgi:hypothetical protein